MKENRSILLALCLLLLTGSAFALSRLGTLGQEIVTAKNNQPVVLRGVNFGWWLTSGPGTYHDAQDVARVHSWGANAIRVIFPYTLLEDDAAPGVYKQSGWEVLDDFLAWCESEDVYAILCLYTSPGSTNIWNKGAMWNQSQYQDRLVAIWRAIAERYNDRDVIAGFDLLNEPLPERTGIWRSLALRIAQEIRSVDDHILIVEFDSFDETAITPLPLTNIVYSNHFYNPGVLTHQTQDVVYPGWVVTGENAFLKGEFSQPRQAQSAWQKISIIGTPPPQARGFRLVCKAAGAGRAWFDSLEVELGTQKLALRSGGMENLNFWHIPAGNSGASIVQDWGVYYDGQRSARFDVETQGDGTLLSDPYYLSQQAELSVSCWVKTAGETDASLGIYWYDANGTYFNRDELARIAAKVADYQTRHNVPIYVGELGAGSAFTGTSTWVADVLSIFEGYGWSWTYWNYKEPSGYGSMALYYGGERTEPTSQYIEETQRLNILRLFFPSAPQPPGGQKLKLEVAQIFRPTEGLLPFYLDLDQPYTLTVSLHSPRGLELSTFLSNQRKAAGSQLLHWDGKVKGVPAPPGPYVLRIVARAADGEITVVARGFLLVR